MLTVFVIGDVLGAGIYALVGEVGGEVGGAIWTAFLLAGVLALFTAASYSELVTKYPRAAGAALYVNRACGSDFFTFVVAFAVMASGVTSAATLATAFGGDYLSEFVDLPTILVGLVFVAVISLINFRGIKESVGLNIGLTSIELAGLLLVVVIGARVPARRRRRPGPRARVQGRRGGADRDPRAAPSLAFFALIGFEDSVNVAEETRDPSRVFPRALFIGLAIAGVVYMLVTVIASMAVPTDQLVDSDGPLLEVVDQGPLGMSTKVFAAIALFALDQRRADQPDHGLAARLRHEPRGDRAAARSAACTRGAARPTWRSSSPRRSRRLLVIVGDLETLADTTVLLLLFVFVCVNAAVLVLRREPVDHEHFRAPTRRCRCSASLALRRADRPQGVRRPRRSSPTPAG